MRLSVLPFVLMTTGCAAVPATNASTSMLATESADPPSASAPAATEASVPVSTPPARDPSLPDVISPVDSPFASSPAICTYDIDLARTTVYVRTSLDAEPFAYLWRGSASLSLGGGAEPIAFVRAHPHDGHAEYSLEAIVHPTDLVLHPASTLLFAELYRAGSDDKLTWLGDANGSLSVRLDEPPGGLSLPLSAWTRSATCTELSLTPRAPTPLARVLSRELHFHAGTVPLRVSADAEPLGTVDLREGELGRVLSHRAGQAHVELAWGAGVLSGWVPDTCLDPPPAGRVGRLGGVHHTRAGENAASSTQDSAPYSCPTDVPLLVHADVGDDPRGVWRNVGIARAKSCIWLGDEGHLGATRNIGVEGVMPVTSDGQRTSWEIVATADSVRACRPVKAPHPPEGTPRWVKPSWHDACRHAFDP